MLFLSQLKCMQVKPNEFKQDFFKCIILKKKILEILKVFFLIAKLCIEYEVIIY